MDETVKTFVYKEGTVIVHKPILTEEEYESRKQQVSRAAAALLREKYAAEEGNKNEKQCV